jgi:hypothetical protein
MSVAGLCLCFHAHPAATSRTWCLSERNGKGGAIVGSSLLGRAASSFHLVGRQAVPSVCLVGVGRSLPFYCSEYPARLRSATDKRC